MKKFYRTVAVAERLPKVANENYLTISKNGIETARFFNGSRFETAHYEGDIVFWLEEMEDVGDIEQRIYVEEANNEMLIQELNSQKTHIQNLIDVLIETEKQLRDVYNNVEFEGKFPVRSALDKAKELIEQHDNGFI